MDYELIEKLKKAGLYLRKYSDESSELMYRFDGDEEQYYMPTLEELIEACGEEIRLQSYYSENDLMWQADNWNNFETQTKELIAGTGPTPLEAVANLWLALQVKEERE